jgi:hypothetical protein
MTAPVPVTPADAVLLDAAASLARHAPEAMRSRHLAERLDAFAVRVRVALEAGRNGLGDPGHEGKGLATVASLPAVQS